MQLVLASKSPRRIEILKELGENFEIIPSQCPEFSLYKRPSLRVTDLATQKAFDVARKYPGKMIVGADTLVFCKGEIIGKPKSKADALRILRKLNGSWQSVYTGMCIICLEEHKALYGYEISKCKARKLDEKQLQHLAGKHMDKAGAYAVQDEEDPFIERIIGSRSNVVGFPTELYRKMKKEFLAK